MSYFRIFLAGCLLAPFSPSAKLIDDMWPPGARVGCETRAAAIIFVAKVAEPGQASFFYVREERQSSAGNRIVIHSRRESLAELSGFNLAAPSSSSLPILTLEQWTKILMDPQEAAFAKYARRHWPETFIQDLRSQALKNLDRSVLIEAFSPKGQRLGSMRIISAEFVQEDGGPGRQKLHYRPLPEEEILNIVLPKKGVITSQLGDPVRVTKGINSEVSSYFIEESLKHSDQARVHAELWVTMLEMLNGPGLSLVNRHGHRLHTYADEQGIRLYRPWGFGPVAGASSSGKKKDTADQAISAYGIEWTPLDIGWNSLDSLKSRLARSLRLDDYDDINAGQGELDDPATWMRHFREFPEIDLEKDPQRAEAALDYYARWLHRRDAVAAEFDRQLAFITDAPWLDDYLEVKTSLEVIRLGIGHWLTSEALVESGRRKFRLRVLIAALGSIEGQSMVGTGAFTGPWHPIMESLRSGQDSELIFTFTLLRAVYRRGELLEVMGGLLDLDLPIRFGPPPPGPPGTLREQVRNLKQSSEQNLLQRGVTLQQRRQWTELFNQAMSEHFDLAYEKFKELFVGALGRDPHLARDFLRTIVDRSMEDWRP